MDRRECRKTSLATLATFVAPDLEDKNHERSLAWTFLQKYGDSEQVRRSFSNQLLDRIWVGFDGSAFNRKRQKYLKLKENANRERDANVLNWIDEYAEQLLKRLRCISFGKKKSSSEPCPPLCLSQFKLDRELCHLVQISDPRKTYFQQYHSQSRFSIGVPSRGLCVMPRPRIVEGPVRDRGI